MPTANESKALWFLAIVALSGSSVRLWRSNASRASAAQFEALDRQIQRVDSARTAAPKRLSKAADASKADSRESRTPVDLDRATEAEIEALPGIGPALAKRIITNRDSAGTFGFLGAICDVRGIGPALAQRLRPLVTFTGPRRPVSDTCGESSKTPRKGRGSGGYQRR